MSDKYNPQLRLYCEHCNCWYANNRASIESHEQGTTHQTNVRKKLDDTQKRNHDNISKENLLRMELAKIEAAAMKSFEEDAKRDPYAQDELLRVKEARMKAATSNITNKRY